MMLDTKEKVNTLKGRYERTLMKKKKVLKTTLINTTPKQARIIIALMNNSGIKVTAKTYGPHQLLEVQRAQNRTH